jgi:hypothetical protein
MLERLLVITIFLLITKGSENSTGFTLNIRRGQEANG